MEDLTRALFLSINDRCASSQNLLIILSAYNYKKMTNFYLLYKGLVPNISTCRTLGDRIDQDVCRSEDSPQYFSGEKCGSLTFISLLGYNSVAGVTRNTTIKNDVCGIDEVIV